MAKKPRKTKEQNLEGLLQFLRKRAKAMRLKPTKWEAILKNQLIELGYKFKSQVPIICREKYGYIMDFLLLDYNIFIECNSKQYHYSNKQQIKDDNTRSRRIQKEGYFPLVLTNTQIGFFTKEMVDQIIKTKIAMLNSVKNTTTK